MRHNNRCLAIIFFTFFILMVVFESNAQATVLDEINRDYRSNLLTLDQYILKKAQAVFSPEKPLRKHRGLSPGHPIYRKCGTPIILEIRRVWKQLRKSTQDQLKWIFLRPTDTGGGYDNETHTLPTLWETEHFTFHYTTGSDGGSDSDAPVLTDTDDHGQGTETFNDNNAPDFIENFGVYFEDTYTEEVTNRGYNTFPNDSALLDDSKNRNPDGNKYDVFVYSIGDGLYGTTNPEEYPKSTSYSYIDVNNSYDWAPYNDDPDEIAKGAMKVTAAHEFFHAIQFTYDTKEDSWWMEATSTYMEDEVYPDTNDLHNYMPSWFEQCDVGLKKTDGSHEYGSFIFATRLSEVFGDDIIRQIWVEMMGAAGLTAISNALDQNGSSLAKEFHDFTQANFFLKDSYSDGASYKSALTGTTTYTGVWQEYQYNETTHGVPWVIDNLILSNTSDAKIDKWATDYVTISMNGQTANYTIWFDGLDENTAYDVSLVTKSGTTITSKDFTLASKGSLDLAYSSSYDSVVVIIRNAGNTDSADPAWRMALTTPLEVSITASASVSSAGLDFDFSASVSGGISPFSYSWDFGDGNTSTKENPTHSFTNAGIYRALLTVTDSWGGEKISDIKEVTVTGSTSGGGNVSNVTEGTVTDSTSGGGDGDGGCAMTGPRRDARDVSLLWIGVLAIALFLRRKMRDR